MVLIGIVFDRSPLMLMYHVGKHRIPVIGHRLHPVDGEYMIVVDGKYHDTISSIMYSMRQNWHTCELEVE
jgi:hypothetical protein